MNNTPHISPEDLLFCGSTDSPRKKMLLVRKKRLVDWMRDVLPEFCKGGELALGFCARTLATEKACFELPVHCRFIECEVRSAFFQNAFRLLLKVYAK